MQIELNPEQREFIRRAVASGRLRRAEDAVQEALLLWMDRERRRDDILAAIDEAEESLNQAEAIPINQGSMRELAGDVKSHGRMRARAITSE